MERDLHYFKLILSSIVAIEDYVKDISEEKFINNDVLRHAVLMRLIVIGEYGGKISEKSKIDFK